MSACLKECPICMDDILETNCVITECGHSFHTSCLMKNAAHNGFGCPYCRSVMAEVPEEEEDEEDEDDYSSSNEDEDEPFSNYSLRGMRWLFLRINNLPIEEEDEEEEEEEEEPPVPTGEYIAKKLEEENITFNDLVISLLAINHQEYENKDDYQTKEDEIFDKIQLIISNFRAPDLDQDSNQDSNQETTINQVPIQEAILDKEEKIDFCAQPKERRNKNNILNEISISNAV